MTMPRLWPIPDLQVVVVPEHVDFARHARGLAQPLVDDDASLRVDLGGLAEIVHAVENT